MVDMLATCAEGRSLSIDAKCQSIFKTDELLGSVRKGERKPGILLKPKICPARKTPFLRFLVSVYVDCEGPEKLYSTKYVCIGAFPKPVSLIVLNLRYNLVFIRNRLRCKFVLDSMFNLCENAHSKFSNTL